MQPKLGESIYIDLFKLLANFKKKFVIIAYKMQNSHLSVLRKKLRKMPQ